MSSATKDTTAGRAVQKRRAEKGYTQEALADASGVSRRTIQSLELGEHAPRLEALIRIEQALDWAPGYLLERVDSDGNHQDDTWRETRRLLMKALALDDPEQIRQVVADALVALGRSDPAQ